MINRHDTATIKNEIKKFCERSVADMVAFINLSPLFDVDGFKVKRRYSFSSRRIRSWGGQRWGQPFISLSLIEYLARVRTFNQRPMLFTEYGHIKDHPVIGEMRDVHWQKALRGLIAHEIAHAVEHSIGEKRVKIDASFNAAAPLFYKKDKLGRSRMKRVEGHGRLWQYIYFILRREFVNNYQPVEINFAPKIKQKKDRKLVTKVIDENTSRYQGQFDTYKTTRYYAKDGRAVADVVTHTTGGYGRYAYSGDRRSWTAVYFLDENGKIADTVDADDGRKARKIVYNKYGR